jgi:hypothetical protein
MEVDRQSQRNDRLRAFVQPIEVIDLPSEKERRRVMLEASIPSEAFERLQEPPHHMKLRLRMRQSDDGAVRVTRFTWHREVQISPLILSAFRSGANVMELRTESAADRMAARVEVALEQEKLGL